MLLSTTTCFPLSSILQFSSPLSILLSASPLPLLPLLSLSLSLSSLLSLSLSTSTMATGDRGKPLPRFGEWDVNNPASAEGFTVIFSKASEEKKTKKASGLDTHVSPHQNQNNSNQNPSQDPQPKKKWFCFR